MLKNTGKDCEKCELFDTCDKKENYLYNSQMLGYNFKYYNATCTVYSEKVDNFWEWFEELSFRGKVNECKYAEFRCPVCKKIPSESFHFGNKDEPPEWKYCPWCGTRLKSEKDMKL